MQPAAGLAKSQRRAKLQFGRFVGVEPRRREAFGLEIGKGAFEIGAALKFKGSACEPRRVTAAEDEVLVQFAATQIDDVALPPVDRQADKIAVERSEERRVGRECASTGTTRGAAAH